MAKPYSKLDSTRHATKDEKPPKQRKPINKVSAKLKEGAKLYAKERLKYLHAFPMCEVRNCKNEATTIHHKSGRVGELLFDPENFLACCMECHIAIEISPVWAKAQGYSISRL